ncbi:sulfotransferase family protein [Marinoscillum sp.]|uniref:sulfotransferase family protein n=1 Tax=Marinoscillum sp. TaxID=2024838 RepID=UPI003BA8ED77
MLDFVGIGVSKSATSWLAKNLMEHPGVFIPNSKELHFFNGRKVPYDDSLKYLKNLYKDKISLFLCGEFTPRYFASREALLRIRESCPDTKIILSLRNPIERALSQHKYFVYNKKKENCLNPMKAFKGFYKADYIDKSLYSENLRYLLSLFNSANIKVVFYDDIVTEPQLVFDAVCDFLKIERMEVLNEKINRTNSDYKGGISLLINFYNKVLLNIDYAANFKQTKEYKFLQLIGNYRLLRAGFLKLKPLVQVLGRIESKVINYSMQSLKSDEKISLLSKYFVRDVERLESILGKDLSHWKTISDNYINDEQ